MMQYYLMHKNDICGLMTINENSGRVAAYKDGKERLSPYLGNADLRVIQKWWKMRAAPESRTTIQKSMKELGCPNPETYLTKNLGISVSDTYWICPAGTSLTYEEIRRDLSSYDPGASLGGQMEKYWDLDQEISVLVKESSKYFGQQSMNEVVATRIHELQGTDIPFVRYTAEIVPGHGIISRCNAFTSEKIELITAYEVIESRKADNSLSLYDHFIETCVKGGIDREVIQRFMDYQTMTDFVISNTDEHLNNFGVLRDADTMKLLGPAPIYDSGNSMFYKDERYIPYTRAGLLERPITAFYSREDKMLAKVRDRGVLKTDLLPDKKEIFEMYVQAGIPEPKAVFISENYETKLGILKEFQQGKTVSLYHERELEKRRIAMRIHL